MVIRALTRPSRPMCALAAIGALALIGPAHADLCNITAGARLLPSGLTPSAWFGNSVALTGTHAVVGAPLLMVDGLATGAAYVYARSGFETWQFDGALVGSEVMPFDNLGWSVAIDGTTAIVGAWGDDELGTDAGAAYIFVREKSGWVEQARLTASDGAAGDNFGWSVAIHADTAIIGAWFDDDRGTNSGAAYIFVRSGEKWTQQTKLTASNGQANDLFGSSVAMHGDRAVVGAYLNDAAATNAGAAYVFVRKGGAWTQQGILTAPDAGANDFFGLSVSCHEGRILVGAPRSDPTFLDAGAAYVFVRPNNFWIMEAKLTASDGRANDQLGYSVSLRGDGALVGAPGDDDDMLGGNAGSASYFFFTGSEWLEGAKLLDPTGAEDNQAGLAVALGDADAIVGSYLDDAMETDGGSARMYYDFFCGPPGPCEGDADGNGTVDIDDVTFVLLRFGLCPNEPECVGEEQTILLPSGPTGGDRFGHSVAIDGDTLVVGSWLFPDNGAVYVFVRTGEPGSEVWIEQAKLIPNSSEFNDFFGFSVAIQGDTALIGAPGADVEGGGSFNQGMVYIFTRTGSIWTETSQLTATPLRDGAQFGYSLDFSGDTVLVGAPFDFDSPPTIPRGSAYVFRRSTESGSEEWMQEARLIGMTTLTQDRFGWSVALEGDTAVIGSQQDDEAAGNGGAVFVFVRSGPPGSEMWIETAKLLASDAEDQDQFGFAVAISGSTILATNNISEIDTASAYVFERSGPPGSGIWNEQSKLSLPGIGAPGIFGNGNSVALEGNRALISFETDSELELAGGSVGVFVRSGPPGSEVWSLEGTLRPSNPAEGALFGWSLAIQGDEIVIGAPYNASTTTAGVAYLFNYTCITEFECPGDMDNNGVVDVDDLTFVILRLGTCL